MERAARSIRTRVGGFPDLLGTAPIAIAPKEITTPGKGQLRALLIAAGNPVTSAPNRAEWDDALPRLDLLVSLDFYVTETNRHADYILPATTFLERDDYPWFIGGHMTPPYAVWTDAVEPPRGEARPEWWVVAELSKRLKIEPSAVPAVRALGKLGIRLPPAKAIDLFLRTGSEGDLYGLRPKGLSLKKLRRTPAGRLLADRCETGVLQKRVFHKDKRVHFDHPEIRKAMARLIPREIAERRKQGFSGPYDSWYRGESLDYIQRLLSSPQARYQAYLDPRFVACIIGEHTAAHRNHRLLIWSLLCFEVWLRKFM
jgi:formate dehydrogenase